MGRATIGSITAVMHHHGDAAAAALQQPISSASPDADSFNVPHAAAAAERPTHTLVKCHISAQSLRLTPGPTPVVTPGHKGKQKLFIPFIHKNMQRVERAED